MLPAILTALAACSKQPSFDERYEKASAEIDARVKALDAAVIETETVEGGANGAQTAKGGADAKAPPIKFSLPVQGGLAKEAPSSGE